MRGCAIARLRGPARRGIVPARGVIFHDKSIDFACGFPDHGLGDDIRRDNGQKLRTLQRKKIPLAKVPGIELMGKRDVFGIVFNVKLELHRLPFGNLVQYTGNGKGDPGAHQHGIDPGKDRPEEGRQCRQLDLFEVIDAHHPVMAFLGQEYLCKIGHDHHFHHEPFHPDRGSGNQFEGLLGRFAARDEKGIQNTLSRVLPGEMRQCPPDISVEISQLKAPCDHRIDGGA